MAAGAFCDEAASKDLFSLNYSFGGCGLGSHKNLYKKFLRRMVRKVFYEAYFDRDKAEFVALNNYPILNIEQGDVLKTPIYIHPSLSRLQL